MVAHLKMPNLTLHILNCVFLSHFFEFHQFACIYFVGNYVHCSEYRGEFAFTDFRDELKVIMRSRLFLQKSIRQSKLIEWHEEVVLDDEWLLGLFS